MGRLGATLFVRKLYVRFSAITENYVLEKIYVESSRRLFQNLLPKIYFSTDLAKGT